jgi:hypothetical protein
MTVKTTGNVCRSFGLLQWLARLSAVYDFQK